MQVYIILINHNINKRYLNFYKLGDTMIKKRFLEKRKYRRYQKNNNHFKVGIFIILIMGAVFFLWNSLPPGEGTLRAISTSTSEDSSWQKSLYRSILKQAIPGMVEAEERKSSLEESNKSEVNSHNDSRNLINSTLYALTNIDPNNPKTFLNAQICTMQQVTFLNERSLKENTYNVDEGKYEENEAAQSPHLEPEDSEETEGISNTLRPLVIIYHTHTTESFMPTTGKPFTDNLDETVVRVAEELAHQLEKNYNVRVIHNKEIHDIPRSESYQKAVNTVKDLVSKYSEADLVIDLHRDGTTREATTTQINGEDVGKTLMMLGTNHENWDKNYEIAIRIHEKSEALFPSLSRGVRKRSLTYNQDVHPGAVLLEIGGHKNSLEEALRTSRYVATILGEVLNEM